MKFITHTRAAVVAGLLALATATAGTAALTVGPATAGTGIPHRAASLRNSQLFGVAATSARNAWAVGQAVSSGKSIILHWNGTAWTRVPSPTARGGTGLYAVAATSARNAWAVGNSGAEPGKTEILHWNGTTWTHVPSPTPKGGGALFGVAAVSARNAWAVGCAGNCFQGFGNGLRTLILHWNGTTWSRVPSPSPGLGSALSSVAATSARNAWAVGCTAFCFLSSVSPHTVILHWNGTTWTRMPSPALAKIGALNGVAATSARNAWAVGCASHCFGPTGGTTETMIVHWNGTAWKHVASPRLPDDSRLAAVAATSARNAWAVGSVAFNKTLIIRWNGTAWKHVASPTYGQSSELLGVAATSARNAWAIGWDLKGLILQHWNGAAWK